jgi:predicted ATP-dependent endonuclease of OLD family
MKIRDIGIQNYKCHKNTIISNCSDFHTLVGRNSSGKTSILDCCQLVKNHAEEIDDIKGRVYGTITKNETKEIILKLHLQLSNDERRHYLNLYFPFINIDDLLSTNILRTISTELSISVRGDNVSKENFDNHIIITMMKVSDTKGNFIPIIKQNDFDNKFLQVSILEQGTLKNSDMQDTNSIDKYMANLAQENYTQKSEKLNFWKSETHFFQNEFVKDFKKKLNIIGSVRESRKQVDTHLIRSGSEVDERGTSIINLIDSLYSNSRERYNNIENKCKEIFQDITEIYPKLVEGDKKIIAIKKKNIPYDIDLFHEGTGLDQLLIIIWKIATSEPGTICILDEPELHLHPGAQNLLYEFLKEETKNNKQIFVATQSMVFIHNSELNEVSIILNDQNSLPQVALLKDLILEEQTNASTELNELRKYVYDALGYDPLFAFEPKTIVMVEGKTDKYILPYFAETLGYPVNRRATMFMPLGNAIEVKKYTPIVRYALSGKKCLIVLDNDNKSPDIIIKEILENEKKFMKSIDGKSVLDENNFCPFPEYVYSIEFYLLEPDAIYKASGSCDENLLYKIKDEIDQNINDIKNKKIKPKEFLKDIWENNSFGRYDEVHTAAKIAQSISKTHLKNYPEIEVLVKAIS